jgi:hypothetical protein
MLAQDQAMDHQALDRPTFMIASAAARSFSRPPHEF